MEAFGITFPVFTLTLSFCGFIMTIKTAKILRNIFLIQEHPISELPNPSKKNFSNTLKRFTPLIGLCSYKNIQYQIPPIAHIYLFLLYLSLLWSICLGVSGFKQQFDPIFSLASGTTVTIFSIAISILFYTAFISSYNRSDLKVDEKEFSSIQQQKTVISNSKPERKQIQAVHGKLLETWLTATMLIIALTNLFSVSFVQNLSDEAILAGIYNFLLALVVDFPIRAMFGLLFKVWKILPVYQKIYLPLDVYVRPLDLPKYGRTPSMEDSRQIWPEMPSENSLHLVFPTGKQRSSIKLSPIKEMEFSPIKRDRSEIMSYDDLIQKMTPDQSSEGQEFYRRDSQMTLTSHNEESLDQIILTPRKFWQQPTAQASIQTSPSPKKNVSPMRASPLRVVSKGHFKGDSFNLQDKENAFSIYKCQSMENIEEEEPHFNRDVGRKMVEKEEILFQKKQIQGERENFLIQKVKQGQVEQQERQDLTRELEWQKQGKQQGLTQEFHTEILEYTDNQQEIQNQDREVELSQLVEENEQELIEEINSQQILHIDQQQSQEEQHSVQDQAIKTSNQDISLSYQEKQVIPQQKYRVKLYQQQQNRHYFIQKQIQPSYQQQLNFSQPEQIQESKQEQSIQQQSIQIENPEKANIIINQVQDEKAIIEQGQKIIQQQSNQLFTPQQTQNNTSFLNSNFLNQKQESPQQKHPLNSYEDPISLQQNL